MTPFINSNDRLFMRARPYEGKYAAKSPSVFEDIAEIQRVRMSPEWLYRPINSEIEITEYCNQSCPHCGMSAGKTRGQSYTADELTDYISQLHGNGIISCSLTGGEPFTKFANILHVLSQSRGKVDICKITSNGFWGHDAEKYFSEMVSAGLLENRFIVPCLMISIGEQSTPMEDTCNIFHCAVRNFSPRELALCISSLTEYGHESKVKSFVETYRRLYGELPEDRIFLTENFYRTSSVMTLPANNISGRRVADYMSGPVRCFEPTLGKYILPRMFVKASGDVCTCACFNPPDELRIGNIKRERISDILAKINANPFVRIIAEGGLHNFRHWVSIDECRKIPCNNECEACKYLITEYRRVNGAIIP